LTFQLLGKPVRTGRLVRRLDKGRIEAVASDRESFPFDVFQVDDGYETDIGEDTAPYWKTKPSGFQGPNAYFALKNALLRQFMHRAFWLNDPDCLLLRGRETELTRNERELYALSAGALDNMVIVSDKLQLLGREETGLLRRALGLRGGKSRVEGLLGNDAYLIRSRGGPAGRVALGVNLSDGEAVIAGAPVARRSGVFLEKGQG